MSNSKWQPTRFPNEMTDVPRYCDRPFPPYTYVPGKQPHPVSDPRGHMYGQHDQEPPPLDPLQWALSETYLYAVDLFNHGYYWEAHEAWESLWLAADRTGPTAEFLKGLIKLAAAGVKRLEGNPVGVERHTNRAIELLSGVTQDSPCFAGVHLERSLKALNSGEGLLAIRLE